MRFLDSVLCGISLLTLPLMASAPSPEDNRNEDCFLQGEPLCCDELGSFNRAAVYDVDFNCVLLPFFVDASYTYWHAGQDGLGIAVNGILAADGTLYFAQNTKTFFQNGSYKSGFKVGIGTVLDEWEARAGYTWYRGKNSAQSGALPCGSTIPAGTSNIAPGSPLWVVNDWFLQGTGNGQALAGSSISSFWELEMDLVDLTVGRPYYQACSLVVDPYAGLRLAFIRQRVNVSLMESTELAGITPPPGCIYSKNRSTSWAVGPRFGMDSKWLLFCGARLEAEIAGNILFTQYNVKHSEDPASITFSEGPYTARYCKYNCLRPIAEMALGLGWARYYCNRSFHSDLLLKYEFSYLWAQNMIRRLLDDTLTGTGPANADLYYHGLTVTVRLDF